MSIYGPSACLEVDYATNNFVGVQDSLRVLKVSDTMTGNLDRGEGDIWCVVCPLRTHRCTTSWAQAVGLVQDAVGDLQVPKPLITVWAEERGNISSGEYEWAFRNGTSGNGNSGYPMMAAGRVLRMGLSASTSTGSPGTAVVNIVVNGTENTAYWVLKPPADTLVLLHLKSH